MSRTEVFWSGFGHFVMPTYLFLLRVLISCSSCKYTPPVFVSCHVLLVPAVIGRQSLLIHIPVPMACGTFYYEFPIADYQLIDGAAALCNHAEVPCQRRAPL